ncbi:Hypothetical_protein [Hexamita inflata]|uniref:Hypothetical_protein n=1 Tax=Hexamita inflata TaxID=28002 RepID=A0AA86NRR8_9EUKA|nr:Hypothetical protein HINF_LOCUS12034 [Hexamita inflata]
MELPRLLAPCSPTNCVREGVCASLSLIPAQAGSRFFVTASYVCTLGNFRACCLPQNYEPSPMLILRSRTLILRTRELIGQPLLLLLNDASEADHACLTVIFTTQINPRSLSLPMQRSTISKRVARISRLRIKHETFQLIQ